MPADAREFGKGTLILAILVSFIIGAHWKKIKEFIQVKVLFRK